MGSFHGHIPLYFVLILVLSSNHILATARKVAKADSKATADFQAKAKLAEKNPIKNDTDFKSLAKLDLNNAIADGSAIYGRITSELRKTSSPHIQRSLTSCSANYENAINQLKKSLVALDAKRYEDAQTLISGAKAFAMTCEDRFYELVNHSSPIADMKTKFDQVCRSGIGHISSLIQKEPLTSKVCNKAIHKHC